MQSSIMLVSSPSRLEVSLFFLKEKPNHHYLLREKSTSMPPKVMKRNEFHSIEKPKYVSTSKLGPRSRPNVQATLSQSRLRMCDSVD